MQGPLQRFLREGVTIGQDGSTEISCGGFSWSSDLGIAGIRDSGILGISVFGNSQISDFGLWRNLGFGDFLESGIRGIPGFWDFRDFRDSGDLRNLGFPGFPGFPATGPRAGGVGVLLINVFFCGFSVPPM